MLLVSRARAEPFAVDQDRIARGKLLYLQNCVICHQSSGQGSPGVFPPLAKADFLMTDKNRSILALAQGLSGTIEVNGKRFSGVMPPAALDDGKVADVLTFVRNSFGNSGEAIGADEVKRVRATSRFPTFEVLQQANSIAPLPAPPPGFAIRELVRLPDHGTRLASDGQGKSLYVLGQRGDVWRVDIPSGRLEQILSGTQYLAPGDVGTVGLALDTRKRLYIVADQRMESGAMVTNAVTIYRTSSTQGGDPAGPLAWFETSYPWGIGPFNHGVGHIGFGPDGFLYVSSGSRTDGNEPGADPHYFQGGEVPLTACLWRLDPRKEKPDVEIFARGLRNAYGFCWNDKGELFATDNGPDADAPEELNLIERGKHYGFPFQFSNWTRKPYAHTPDAPAGLEFVPIANFGPAAGGQAERPLYTFEPHSSPAGMAFLNDGFPPDFRGTFVLARFGNLIQKPRDAGFDLLQVRLRKNSKGIYEASIQTVLAPLGRPLDVHVSGNGRIYVLEYTRTTNNRAEVGMLPGRILELAVRP